MLNHAPEYLIEAALLGTFMFAACTAVAMVQHPALRVRQRVNNPLARRFLIGVLMGLVAITLIYSPFGQRSGAHMNPAVTLTYTLLGRMRVEDAAWYVAAQFAGGAAGVLLARAVLRRVLHHEDVRFAVTQPGKRGALVAWVGEFIIAGVLMSVVLWSTNSPRVAPYTGLLAGALIVVYITFEAPLSGMSMNPARSLASAIHAGSYRSMWVYFTAPPLAMLSAAALYVGVQGSEHVKCGKLQHPERSACIFNCRMSQDERTTH